MSRKSVS